jgi:acyl dehydratase
MWFDEFRVGMVFEHPIARTVTEADNVLFCSMTMNPQPLHLDVEFSAKSEFGKPIVNSLFTLGLMIGISVYDTTLGTTIANLEMTEVLFPAPVFHGDTLRIGTEVEFMRECNSRPAAGIVKFRHRAFKQSGVEVASCLRTAMMHRNRRMMPLDGQSHK